MTASEVMMAVVIFVSAIACSIAVERFMAWWERYGPVPFFFLLGLIFASALSVGIAIEL